MPYREMKLSQARKLVETGEVDAAQIAGLEGWSEDSVITVPLKAKDASQEGATATDEQSSRM